MGTRLKVLGIVLGVLLALVVGVWLFSDVPSFGDWMAGASEAEASFWGAIIGALSSGMIAVTILAADLDHRERQNIDRRLSLARALKAEIADTISGLTAGIMNLEYQSRALGKAIPTTKMSLLYTRRPLITSPPEAIYELGGEVGRLFARLRTLFIKIEINSVGDHYQPGTGAPLLEASIDEATGIGSELLALIDRVDGEPNDLNAGEWRDFLMAHARDSFDAAQKVRAKSGAAAAIAADEADNGD